MLENVKGFVPLNFGLLANPYNWIVISLMIAIGGLALGLIFHPANIVVSANTADDGG
jgi:hypothetical protein